MRKENAWLKIRGVGYVAGFYTYLDDNTRVFKPHISIDSKKLLAFRTRYVQGMRWETFTYNWYDPSTGAWQVKKD